VLGTVVVDPTPQLEADGVPLQVCCSFNHGPGAVVTGCSRSTWIGIRLIGLAG
jgi:hypothetical protein